jgi:predicted MFS family arabinose efflux permease
MLAFTAYAAALIAARLLFGHLPDKLGGALVASIFALVEAAGLGLIWLAPGLSTAVLGAVLTGFGYSLVYPGFGAEAVRAAPAQSRGLASLYTSCLDLALGFGSPALGLVAGTAGLPAVFLISGVVVLGAAGVAVWLLRSSSRS